MSKQSISYTEKAVELAIAGGWNPSHMQPDFFGTLSKWKKYTIYHPDKHKFFLDPKFWLGLQKALKAKEPRHKWTKKNGADTSYTLADWFENTMHSFIDHLLSGVSMEEFFRQLIIYHQNN